MPWAPPSWCAVPRHDDSGVTVTLQSHKGEPRRHDLSGCSYYLLEGCRPKDEKEQTSRWHAAVLRNEQGHCFIMDLSSATGTFMKEQRLKSNTPYRWNPGTTAVLGVPLNHVKATLEISRGAKRSREAGAVEEAPAGKRRAAPDTGTSAHGGACSSGSAAGRAAPAAKPVCRPVSTGKCDKCDGPHATEACPHFRKPRDDHKDAWVNYGKKHPLQMGRSGAKLILQGGRAVPQPGDGSCLFHSLCFGLNGGRPNGRFAAGRLRKELAQYVQSHPRVKIAGDTLEEWVRWDTNSSVDSYTRRIRQGGWGGGIEMAACSILMGVNVHVYERRRGGTFERISCFDSPKPTKQTIHVLYQGGVHYDALVPR